MKKIISITMAIMLLLSSLFITTAFAKTASADEVVINPNESASSDEVTTYSARPAIPIDPTTPGLDAETELEIKQEVMDFYSLAEDGLTTDDVTLEYFGTLSDGSVLIRYRFTGMGTIDVIIEDIIGNYEYIVDAAQQVDLYKNGTIYTIKDAYYTGVITDNVLDEAAEILDFTYVDGDTAGLDVKTVLQIKQDVLNYLSWGDELTIDDVSIVYKGTLSDGSMLIRYETTGMDFDAAVHVDEIGSYIYTYGAPDMFSIYKNNTFYTIKGAYDTGVITDDVLDEIAKILNFTSANEQTEPTVPNVTDETNPQTTPDETKSHSTPDTVANVNNSNSDNSAIQTGQNASSVLAAIGIVTLLAAGALLVLKRRRV